MQIRRKDLPPEALYGSSPLIQQNGNYRSPAPVTGQPPTPPVANGPRMNIYIGNLHLDITEEDLKKIFSKYGKTTNARIVRDRLTGFSKGYGFVEMPNDQEAKAAIEALNGTELYGNIVKVSYARSREPGFNPTQPTQPE